MLEKIITRPVLATVISIVLVLLGLVSMQRIPITMFPDIAPPTVNVSGSYPGGNSESVIRSVITPLEDAINGVENMEYISSSAGSDGSFSLRIVFKQGVDPDQAAVNVQNRVAQVNSLIPSEVVQAGITTTKQQNSSIMYFDISSTDTAKYDELFLQNYAKINLVTSLKRIPGIGNVQILGSKDYAMRIWLDPQKMTVHGLVPQDIEQAIANSSLEASPGKLGEESDAPMQYTMKYKGKLNRAQDFERIVIRSNTEGAMLRLNDVAKIELGASFYGSDNKDNGFPAVVIGIQQSSGSNANEIETAVRAQLESFSEDFPEGIQYNIIQSVKERLDQSIQQVRNTFIEAFILVFIVVFLFLQDFRSTLIPAIAVPVAIIGTFFFLQLLGFTMNVLTLFALVLAIGIVVDDAIVVVEAVHAKMKRTGLPAKKATIATMGEITSAIISITLVMSAVFLPIGFMDGPAGIFYKQFAFTLAIAILISALNALTLSPALCALLLTNAHQHSNDTALKQDFKQRFFTAFNAGFDSMTSRYIQAVKWLIKRKWVALAGLGLVTVLSVWMMDNSPKSFIPEEDDRFLTYSLALKSGTNTEYTSKVIDRIDSAFMQMPEVELVTSVSGFDIISGGSGPSYGLGFIRLKEAKDRGEVKDMDDLVIAMNERLHSIREGELSIFRSPPVEGFGSINGAELVLQDRMSGNLDEFAEVTDNLITQLNNSPKIGSAFTMFRNDFPQLEIELDEDKTYQLGTSPKEVMNTLSLFYGGSQSSDFIRFGRFYRVNIKAEGQYRADENSLSQVFIKSNNGTMIPISTLVSLKKVYGPELITRYNLYNNISVNILPADGYSNSQAMDVAEEIMKDKLPPAYGYEWTGLSKEEKESGNQMIFIFSLCVLFTYFLLAGQYESYLLPLAVIFSIPTGLLGVYLAIGMAGLTNSIYVQVGLIMLIGLLAKNGILIVEFALQARQSGMTIVRSALSGSRHRLRPILMTSVAFVAGITPLMFSTGPSAVGNKSISISTAGGMISGVLLGLFIIPVLFVVFQSLQEYFSPSRKPQQEELFIDDISK